MAMVAVRGAMRHELASEVAVEAIIALGAFAVLGGIAGAVADYLVRNELEAQYRRRVAWYCEQQERREGREGEVERPDVLPQDVPVDDLHGLVELEERRAGDPTTTRNRLHATGL